MRIGLIGMSGAGKTMLAQRLATEGYAHIDCDRLIAQQLEVTLQQSLPTFHSLGAWLDMPYTAGFAEREAQFMAYETEVMRSISQHLDQTDTEDLVVDMGGSSIYIEPAVLERLCQQLTIVYLAVSPQAHQAMLDEYLQRPRPIVWNGMYQRQPGETEIDALARCFPKLIATREQRYQALADYTIDYHQTYAHQPLHVFFNLIQGTA